MIVSWALPLVAGSVGLGETARVFEGFAAEEVPTGEGSAFVRHNLLGPAAGGDERAVVVLLHGHPRTSATWHRVAPLLTAAGHRVICPDLRGYGRSRGPAPAPDHSAHSKRAAAADVVQVLDHLDVDRCVLVGHDRGSYVALRLALDHPDRVSHLVLADCIPISEHLDRATADFATRWWHWFFYAQPQIPERVINADPDAWYRTHEADPAAMGEENHAEWCAAMHDPDVVRAMLEDYRAGLAVDADHERADRAAGHTLDMPLLALWSLRDDLEDLYGDVLAVWEPWAPDRRGFGIDSGHHIAEQAPEAFAAAVSDFIAAR